MPRGSRSGGGRPAASARPASTAAAPRPASSVPAPPPPAAAPPQVMTQRQPGLIANIASTAAGVAIGHTVGTAMTSALGFGGGHQPAAEQQQEAAPAAMQPQFAGQQQGVAPCAFELDQFIRCTQQNDLQVCYGFNEALKECRTRYGIQSPQGY